MISPYEAVAAAINRLRTLRVGQKE